MSPSSNDAKEPKIEDFDMILGKYQIDVGKKTCRIEGSCCVCGSPGFPACERHKGVYTLRSDENAVKEARKAHRGICACGFKTSEVEHVMRRAGSYIIEKFFAKKIERLLGTCQPIDFTVLTALGKKVVLRKYNLECCARFDYISTVNEQGQLVCARCVMKECNDMKETSGP